MGALVAVPPLTWLRVLTAWRFAPGVVAAAAVLGGGYGFGVRRFGVPWPRHRSWCFGIGVALLVVVGCSFVGVYDDTLFWVRSVQNIVLLMVIPMLLAVGAPLTLLAAAVPPPARLRLSRVLHSPPLRWATLPLVVTLVLVVPMLVLYLSPLYEQTLRHAWVSGVVGTALLATGFVYFWTRFRIDPTPRAGSHLVTLAITIVEMIGDAVLGVVLWFGPLVAVGFYAALHRGWGPDLRTDQLLGAGVLWAGGDVVGLPFIGIVFSRMVREDEDRAREIDAHLDALAAGESATTAAPEPDTETATRTSAPSRAPSRATSGTGDAPRPDRPDEPPPTRLWWEDDPQLADRFRRH
jgi:cytochrome c oxidase assembly factor CtaG